MQSSKIKVLVACEESQAVCKAFRKRGFEAYSCDIQECSGGHPEWHIHGDALKAMMGGQVVTQDGESHFIDKWDLMIAHPPCTYLSNVCTRGFSLKCTQAEKVVDRWKQRAEAAVFFMYFALAPIEHICIENPVGFMNTAYRKADQIIDPYMFAENVDDKENYVTKRTCFWTKNLPNLKANNLPRPNNAELFGRHPSGKAKTWEESIHGGVARSKTFPGVAKAMAEQWGDYLLNASSKGDI